MKQRHLRAGDYLADDDVVAAHPRLWQLLLAQEPSVSSLEPRPFDRSLLDVLPEDLRTTAGDVLSSGARIAQERVGYEKLSTLARWWDPRTPLSG